MREGRFYTERWVSGHAWTSPSAKITINLKISRISRIFQYCEILVSRAERSTSSSHALLRSTPSFEKLFLRNAAAWRLAEVFCLESFLVYGIMGRYTYVQHFSKTVSVVHLSFS